ncbi:hypothetical protein TrCOL_g8268 [Triparma columacea]|uniref:J domain-containing protein n=1 Tax=Triparma columacea TaxID=722753 RepID=A0A9W7L5V9_9STRA|nr:hypothetical protein TrCOL_g8268 [Triparma columacea]
MSEPDYYSILGVKKDASTSSIHKAYKKLSLIHHPDKNGGNADHFRKLQIAKETLVNSRELYDMYGPSLLPPRGSHLSSAIAKLAPLIFSLVTSFLTATLSLLLGGQILDALPAAIFMGVVSGLTMHQPHRDAPKADLVVPSLLGSSLGAGFSLGVVHVLSYFWINPNTSIIL